MLISSQEHIKSLIMRITTQADQVAFEEFFHLYFTWLKSVAMAIVKKNEDAEEVIEDVFVKVWAMRERLHQVNNIETYLYTATKNRAYNYVKKYYKAYLVEMEEGKDDTGYSISPEEAMIIEELKLKINDAVSLLPPKCKEVFTLVRQEGLSYKKAASLLGVTPKTVENQLAIAIKKIKYELDSYLNDPKQPTNTILQRNLFFCYLFL